MSLLNKIALFSLLLEYFMLLMMVKVSLSVCMTHMVTDESCPILYTSYLKPMKMIHRTMAKSKHDSLLGLFFS